MTNWAISPCPKCGRKERHDSKKRLAQCSICLMRGADAVARSEVTHGIEIKSGKDLKYEDK